MMVASFRVQSAQRTMCCARGPDIVGSARRRGLQCVGEPPSPQFLDHVKSGEYTRPRVRRLRLRGACPADAMRPARPCMLVMSSRMLSSGAWTMAETASTRGPLGRPELRRSRVAGSVIICDSSGAFFALHSRLFPGALSTPQRAGAQTLES